MIEVKNLVKRYGSHIAVDHLSFTVEKGQIYGFLGPNGAGKSTTMNIMTGYLGATEGEVLIDGHDILEEPEKAKQSIGYLPEIPPLYTDMKVGEYLKFVAELKKIERDRREIEIEKVLAMTKLQDVENRLIRNLSKGYRQRVGLAQAIIGFPDIIILDEPTVGLDPKQIIEIRELIKELAKEHTVILSSHILAEISAVCDHIMIISNGKLIASDTPENLEQQMSDAGTLYLEIKADKETVQTILSGVDGLGKWSVEEKETSCIVTIEEGEKRDPREELFYTCAQAQHPILMMQYKKASLEEVFLELTEAARKDAQKTKNNRRFGGRNKKKEKIKEEKEDESSL